MVGVLRFRGGCLCSTSAGVAVVGSSAGNTQTSSRSAAAQEAPTAAAARPPAHLLCVRHNDWVNVVVRVRRHCGQHVGGVPQAVQSFAAAGMEQPGRAVGRVSIVGRLLPISRAGACPPALRVKACASRQC